MNIHEEVLALLAEDKNNNSHNANDKVKISPLKKVNENEILPESIDEILNYAGKFFFRIEDNRVKNGALWVYHDRENTIHAVRFKRMGMKYKLGRGWWIK